MKITIDVARDMEHGEGWSATAYAEQTGKSYTGSGPDLPKLCASLARQVGGDVEQWLDDWRAGVERDYERQASSKGGV